MVEYMVEWSIYEVHCMVDCTVDCSVHVVYYMVDCLIDRRVVSCTNYDFSSMIDRIEKCISLIFFGMAHAITVATTISSNFKLQSIFLNILL